MSGRVRTSLILLLSCLALDSAHADGVDERTYRLWEQFFALQNTAPEEAREVMVEITATSPDDARAWKGLGYLELDQGRPEAALDAFRKAEAITPGDDELRLQIAYVLNSLESNREAYWRFSDLASVGDPQISMTACDASANLKGFAFRNLPDPWFGSFSISPSWEGRFDLAIVPADLQVGRSIVEDVANVYGFVHFNVDSRSNGGFDADIYDANEVVAGLGASLRPVSDLPVTLYAHAGIREDLIDRGRKSPDGDYEAGLYYYNAWGDYGVGCDRGFAIPMTLFADAYGHLATYSEDDYNIILDSRVRVGVNLVRGSAGQFSAYGLLGFERDTDLYYYNNKVEMGPGFAWYPPGPLPLVVRAESLRGIYIDRGGALPNPYGDGYWNHRLAMELYLSF